MDQDFKQDLKLDSYSEFSEKSLRPGYGILERFKSHEVPLNDNRILFYYKDSF